MSIPPPPVESDWVIPQYAIEKIFPEPGESNAYLDPLNPGDRAHLTLGNMVFPDDPTQNGLYISYRFNRKDTESAFLYIAGRFKVHSVQFGHSYGPSPTIESYFLRFKLADNPEEIKSLVFESSVLPDGTKKYTASLLNINPASPAEQVTIDKDIYHSIFVELWASAPQGLSLPAPLTLPPPEPEPLETPSANNSTYSQNMAPHSRLPSSKGGRRRVTRQRKNRKHRSRKNKRQSRRR